MKVRRLVRLLWVALCDVFLFVVFGSLLLNPQGIVLVSIGLAVCATTAVGIVLEVLEHRFAAVINVAAPILAAVAMASSIFWLPMLAARGRYGSPEGAAENAAILLPLSLVPVSLAIITGLLYRTLHIERDRRQSRLSGDGWA